MENILKKCLSVPNSQLALPSPQGPFDLRGQMTSLPGDEIVANNAVCSPLIRLFWDVSPAKGANEVSRSPPLAVI